MGLGDACQVDVALWCWAAGVESQSKPSKCGHIFQPIYTPYHPCMVYLATFGCFFMVNVGKYTIHDGITLPELTKSVVNMWHVLSLSTLVHFVYLVVPHPQFCFYCSRETAVLSLSSNIPYIHPNALFKVGPYYSYKWSHYNPYKCGITPISGVISLLLFGRGQLGRYSFVYVLDVGVHPTVGCTATSFRLSKYVGAGTETWLSWMSGKAGRFGSKNQPWRVV